jgi:precorrin-2/cobalt-factor-2 C20-methyltransferase
MKQQTGTLYGIGVGPGDPELLTIKSARILSEVDVVFAAASTKNDYSLAVNIAGPHIPVGTAVRMLQFPMTKDKEETRKAWKIHAETIISELEQGKNAAFLTLGDPMTYSTYGYILQNIQKSAPHISITTIPGITSYQAAAACINTPLVEGEECLLVVSGICRFHEGLPEHQGHQCGTGRCLRIHPMRRGFQLHATGSKNLPEYP